MAMGTPIVIDTKLSFGEQVKSARMQMLMSQREFAKVLGVSYNILCEWETGKTKPNFKFQRIFREFCNSTLDVD